MSGKHIPRTTTEMGSVEYTDDERDEMRKLREKYPYAIIVGRRGPFDEEARR